MQSKKSIEDHIDELNKIIIDLENIKVKINNEDQTLLLINYLPTSLENLCDTLLYGIDSFINERSTICLNFKKIKKEMMKVMLNDCLLKQKHERIIRSRREKPRIKKMSYAKGGTFQKGMF